MSSVQDKLAVGDVLGHSEIADRRFVVASVYDTDMGAYAITFAREDGGLFMFGGRRAATHALPRAHHLVFGTKGGWHLISRAANQDVSDMPVEWEQGEYQWSGRRGGVTLFYIAWKVSSGDPEWVMTCLLPGLNGRARSWKNDDQEFLKDLSGKLLAGWMKKISTGD